MIPRIVLNDDGEYVSDGYSLVGSVDGAIAFVDIDNDSNYQGGGIIVGGDQINIQPNALYALYKAFSEGEKLGFGEGSF